MINIKQRRKYFRLFISIVLSFLFLGCHRVTLDTNEVKLKSLSSYSLKDFKLSKKVKYFAIIEYPNGYYKTDFSIFVDYGQKQTVDMKYLSNAESSLAMYTHGFAGAIDPKLLVVACIVGALPPHKSLIAIYYVTAKGDVGTIKDMATLDSFMGEIDTPAKVQLYTLFNNPHEAYSYKKLSRGYRLRFDYTITYKTNKRSVHKQYTSMLRH